MTRRKKAEPKTPEQILHDKNERRRADFEAVGVQSDAVHLERNADVEVTRAGEHRDKRRVQTDSARRLDAFEALKEGMKPGAYDAARRLERDMLIRAGLNDRGRPMIRVDESPKGRTDKQIEAAQRIERVAQSTSLREWWLLTTLVLLDQDVRFTNWREAVLHVTGEENPNAQGAVVRSACANLAEAYEKLDGVSKCAA